MMENSRAQQLRRGEPRMELIAVSFSKTRSNFDMVEGLIIVLVSKRSLVPAEDVWLSS
jgi:hypothetical protein